MTTIHLETKFTHGDIVYLKTDPEQHARIVYAIRILPGSNLLYDLCLGDYMTTHCAIEMSSEINIELKTNN